MNIKANFRLRASNPVTSAQGTRYITLTDIKIPGSAVWGPKAGRIMPSSTIVYKDADGFRPWWHNGVGRLELQTSWVRIVPETAGTMVGASDSHTDGTPLTAATIQEAAAFVEKQAVKCFKTSKVTVKP